MRALLAVAGVLILGLCVWLFRSEAVGVVPPTPAARGPAGSATTDVDLADLEGDADARATEPIDALDADVRATLDRGAGPTLVLVRVTSVDAGGPVEHVHVSAWSPDGLQLLSEPGLETDEEGAIEIEVPAETPLLVSAQGDGRRTGTTNVPVAALARGERREIAVAVPTEPDVHLFGIVMRRDTREPVAGARIRAEPRHEDGPAPEARTGNDGRFELRVRSFATTLLACEHDEFGPAVTPVARGHERAIDALEILLEPSASLRVSILGAGANEPRALRIDAQASPRDLAQPAGTLFAGALVTRAAWIEVGSADLRGLPARAPITVVVSRGAREVWRAREPIVLAPGEARELEIRLGSASIAGVAREADGTPAPGELLRLVRELADATDPVARTARLETSDAEGAFEFDALEPGAWFVGPAIDHDADPRHAPAPALERVEIQPGAGIVRRDLVLTRGLVVAGRVVDPGGGAVAGARVAATSTTSLLDAGSSTGPDGSFVVGPLLPGPWTLRARHVDGRASEPVEAAIGREDVVLVLGDTRTLAILVVDASGVPLRDATVTVTAADGRGDARTVLAREDGTVTIPGVDAGPFHVVASAAGPLFGVARDVVPGPSPIVVAALPAATARVLFQGPSASAFLLVVDRGVLLQAAPLVAGRAHEIVGPAGDVDVQLHVAGKRHDRRVRLAREGGPELVFDDTWRDER